MGRLTAASVIDPGGGPGGQYDEISLTNDHKRLRDPARRDRRNHLK
jgi:hypothetical protein